MISNYIIISVDEARVPIFFLRAAAEETGTLVIFMRRSMSLSWRILQDVARKFKALSRIVKKKKMWNTKRKWRFLSPDLSPNLWEEHKKHAQAKRPTDGPDAITRVLQRGMGQNSSDMSWESRKRPEPTNKMGWSNGDYTMCMCIESFNPFKLWKEKSDLITAVISSFPIQTY